MTRFLDPFNSFAFMKLFAPDKHKPLLISFLNATLKLPNEDRIKSIEILHIEQMPDIQNGLLTVMDLECSSEKNGVFMVELQNRNIPEYVLRTPYYKVPSFLEELQGRKRHKNHKAVVVAIANHVFFPEKEGEVISYHKITDIHSGTDNLQALSHVCIEIPKFNKTEEELTTLQDKWLYFFKNSNSSREIPKVVQEEEVSEAYRLVEEFSWTPRECDLYVRENLFITDVFSVREEEVKRLLNEGREKGRKKASLEIAKALLDTLSLEKIIEATGLTKEEIFSLEADDSS